MATPQRKFGLVEFLQQQLIRKDKEIEINPDEVLDKIEAVSDAVEVEDSVALTLFTTPYKWHDGGAASPEKMRWSLGQWA